MPPSSSITEIARELCTLNDIYRPDSGVVQKFILEMQCNPLSAVVDLLPRDGPTNYSATHAIRVVGLYREATGSLSSEVELYAIAKKALDLCVRYKLLVCVCDFDMEQFKFTEEQFAMVAHYMHELANGDITPYDLGVL